jgi:hypothetical protein
MSDNGQVHRPGLLAFEISRLEALILATDRDWDSDRWLQTRDKMLASIRSYLTAASGQPASGYLTPEYAGDEVAAVVAKWHEDHEAEHGAD